MIGGNEFGWGLLAISKLDKDRRRLLDEIERAGEDVAIGRNHEARGRPVGEKCVFDDIQAADGADLNDRGRDGIRGGFKAASSCVASDPFS